MNEEDKKIMNQLLEDELKSYEKHFKIVLNQDEYERGILMIELLAKSAFMAGIVRGLNKALEKSDILT